MKNKTRQQTKMFKSPKLALLLSSLLLICILIATCGLFSCSPSEKKVDLPAAISSDALSYKVTQNPEKDNIVYLESETPEVIPFWDYGSGSSIKKYDTIIFPFSGDYVIHYSVSSGGGFVPGDSSTVHVTNTDLSYLTDPSWELLAGTSGKTWVLDMTKPIGWYGPDYVKHNGSADDWSYHPDYVGNEWVMPNRDYGSMRFDLNNGKNYTVTTLDEAGNPTTKKAHFDINTDAGTIKLIGAELLFGGDYHSQVSSWTNVTIIELSESSITLGVWRDKGEGLAWIGYTYKLVSTNE